MMNQETKLHTAISLGKQAWVEPEIQQLNVSETAAASGTGSDGNMQYADCTRS